MKPDRVTDRLGLACMAACGVSGSHLAQFTTCPPDASGQDVTLASNPTWFAELSDSGADRRLIETISVPDGEQVTGLTIWGLLVEIRGPTTFVDCFGTEAGQQSELLLDVAFYETGSYALASPACTEIVAVTPVAMPGQLYSTVGGVLQGFRADLELDTPCAESVDRVSVQGTAEPETCWFYWLSSPSGDDAIEAIDEGDLEELSGDLAVCVQTEPITPLEPCEGDANGDQEVTVADVLFIIARFGSMYAGEPLPGDVNSDQQVTIADVLYCIARFGDLCPSGDGLMARVDSRRDQDAEFDARDRPRRRSGDAPGQPYGGAQQAPPARLGSPADRAVR